MSDYESDFLSQRAALSTEAKPKKKAVKRKASESSSRSDDRDLLSQRAAVSAAETKAKKKVAKRKDSATKTIHPSETNSSKNPTSDIFELEDTTLTLQPKSRDYLGSSLISRVDNGKVRRSVNLSGEFYVDLKVYHRADIASTPREDRWKKAAVALKVQLDKGSSQWDALSIFMRRAHTLFDDAEPVYYSDKIFIK